MYNSISAVISSAFIIFGAFGADSVSVPSTNCYAIDNTSYLHDFSGLVGQLFEYDDDKDADLVVRFCKDVESRSQPGYVAFGRFDKFNPFTAASSGQASFVQNYYNGDLMKCEKSYDKLGRTAQVNIICGSCPNGHCIGGLGCICKVTYESTCRVLVDLAIPCGKSGLRVFEGFTVGFHPRSWEIVYNGMTQLGYEKAYDEFSFRTEQDLTLYLTAAANLSNLVQKPTVKISPEQGLVVQLSGSGAIAKPPTTLSPTTIHLDWTCEKVRDTPYEVEITIPVENYDPVQFTLTKMCERSEDVHGESTKGWAIFGIISCVLIVTFTLSCIGGFIYQTRVRNLRGLDAIPGMAILSACLETASGGVRGYTRPDDASDPFAGQAAWDPHQNSSHGARRTSDISYGSI